MILGDILLERSISAEELRAAFTEAFSLPDEQVVIVTSMENAPALRGVTVDTTQIGGQFPIQLAVYVADAESAELADVATKVAKALAVKALIPSDSDDPYKMVLIQPDGSLSEVDINTHSIAEMGEYQIVQQSPWVKSWVDAIGSGKHGIWL